MKNRERTGHGKIVCKCGQVLLQCRCFNHQMIEVVDGCFNCNGEKEDLNEELDEAGTGRR